MVSAKFFESFDGKVFRGTLYLSRSTGQAERTNRRINSALRAIIPPGKESSLDLYLCYATFALNALKNRNMGFSSIRLCFERELSIPINILLANATDANLLTETPTEDIVGQKVFELHKEARRCVRKVREAAGREHLYADRQYNPNFLVKLVMYIVQSSNNEYNK